MHSSKPQPPVSMYVRFCIFEHTAILLKLNYLNNLGTYLGMIYKKKIIELGLVKYLVE